jgi:hypothetical protein
LNPFLVNPLLASGLQAMAKVLPALLVAVLVWQTVAIVWDGHALGLILARAIAIVVLCHWLARRLLQIPLPMERTAIFFVPLAMLLVGIGAALPSRSRVGALRRLAGIGALSLCAIYFLGCLRVSHFKEWKFDAEVKDVFGVLDNMRRRGSSHEVTTDWRYTSPLNFYRECFRDRAMPEFAHGEAQVPGKPVYVLYSPSAESFIKEQDLQVIYHGQVSDVVIAVSKMRE